LIVNDGVFRFSTELEVRWRDVDALGHVNNAVYFTYLEQARVHYVRELGLAPLDPRRIGFILAEASCAYESPLRLAEQVTVFARVEHIGHSSFTLDYRVIGTGERLAATARTVQVCYDYEVGHPIPVPDDWRKAILDFEPGLRLEVIKN
jgi:acyl-CoA thioester hydrolase